MMDIEARMLDVKRRYGAYPQKKWDINMGLKQHFEELTGQDIYSLVEKDTYHPE